MIAGSQGGKTSYGPWWLKREIYDSRGSGDYIAVTSSYDMFKLKMLPSMLNVFEHILKCGRYWAADKVIELAHPISGDFLAKKSTDPMWGRIILRSADALSGLESATAKAAWLDECGQDGFTFDAYKAVRRRIALYRGRILMTSTLYNVGWLTLNIIDRAIETGEVNRETMGESEIDVTTSESSDITVVQFDSILNPMFPREEFEEARAMMPDEEFQMFYRGRKGSRRFLIYDNFDPQRDIVTPFMIPVEWRRYIGLDFGPVHTCAMYYAEDPGTKTLYCYREYLSGDLLIKDHATKILSGEQAITASWGGANSEGQWRMEFSSSGLPLLKPDIQDVDLGINRVYAQHSLGGIKYFSSVSGIIDEKGRYRRKRDKSGQITEDIELKSTFHRLDAERYVISMIRPGSPMTAKVIRLGDNPIWQTI